MHVCYSSLTLTQQLEPLLLILGTNLALTARMVPLARQPHTVQTSTHYHLPAPLPGSCSSSLGSQTCTTINLNMRRSHQYIHTTCAYYVLCSLQLCTYCAITLHHITQHPSHITDKRWYNYPRKRKRISHRVLVCLGEAGGGTSAPVPPPCPRQCPRGCPRSSHLHLLRRRARVTHSSPTIRTVRIDVFQHKYAIITTMRRTVRKI